MTLGGELMKPVGLWQWTGIFIAGAGAVLMVYATALTPAWSGAYLLPWLPMRINWLLLAGVVSLLGGGFLVQFTWSSQHG